MNSGLEERVRRLEDLEEIRRLKSLYCHLVDRSVSGEAAATEELMGHFTEEAWGEYGDFGRYEGRENLALFFGQVVPGILSFTAHMVHNPLIDIHGDEAVGRWYFEVPCTLREKNLAGWLQGRYEEGFVRRGGTWKWAFIKASFDYATPYDQGWARTRMFPL
ncbi:MAG: nuclear transport factor 2 family protein [Thermodesulfobacteriota bacterium]